MSLRTAVSISRKRIPVSLATRDMTVLSKKSGEEYQKQVRPLVFEFRYFNQ